MTVKLKYFKKLAGRPDYSDEYTLEVQAPTAAECMKTLNVLRDIHNNNWYTPIEIVDIQD